MRASLGDLRSRARGAEGARGLVRRLRVSVASGVRWLLLGYDDGANVEELSAEVFTGAGFASRPSSKAEAIVLHVGAAAGHPVVVATRDPAWAATLGDLAAGETALFNGTSLVRIKADGTIHVGSIGGTAEPLATVKDLQDLLAAIAGAAVSAGDGGTTFKANIIAALPALTWPAGTSKLRGE